MSLTLICSKCNKPTGYRHTYDDKNPLFKTSENCVSHTSLIVGTIKKGDFICCCCLGDGLMKSKGSDEQ